MIKRYSLVKVIGDGSTKEPFRPDVTGTTETSYVVIAKVGDSQYIIKQTLADGVSLSSAESALTLADMNTDFSDIKTVNLTVSQKNTITTIAAKDTAIKSLSNEVKTQKDLLIVAINDWGKLDLREEDIKNKFDVVNQNTSLVAV